ncbi:DUF4192 domain-containing protein [Aeromicrobium sp.]|uniref:DUF4192 domain-containing protein n=1 Tax=Aeromicrobium sp. TaxID=1871063 RepID=UPI003C3A4AA2
MTQTPSVYTARDIPDLLNTLPTLFGFRPTESLVAVATHGPRRRFGFRLRVDIPPAEDVDALAQLVAGHLRHQGAEGAIVLAVTGEQIVARDLVAAVGRELDGIPIIVAARANGERYWTDEPGFSPDGIAYESSDHHLAIVQAVAAGQEILPDRDALVRRFQAVQCPRRAWMERATGEVLDEVVRLISQTPAGDLYGVAMAQIQPILDRGLSGQVLSEDDLARFSVWVSGIATRDAVWEQITPETAADMLRVLAEVSRSVVPPFEPAVLSLTAFAAWLIGDGAQSLIATERALAADPEYSMAGLMLQMLQSGVAPSRWQEFRAAGSTSA